MSDTPARLLSCGLCYEENGQEVHPHPECPIGQATAADRAALRDRIAEAIHRSLYPSRSWTRQSDEVREQCRQAADEVLSVLLPSDGQANASADEVAHALDNATPYPIELDSTLCRFMAERLLEMLTVVKRPEHPVWQPEEQPEPGEQPKPQDPDELRRLANESQPAAEAVRTPCSVPECDFDGTGEPCTRHEREDSHAEGNHELCGADCASAGAQQDGARS
jgi:hypothetical protein